MEYFVQILSLLLLAVIVTVCIRTTLNRSWDLMSWRNLFLLGFIHFYCLSAYFTASGETLPEFLRLTLGGWTKLALMMTMFIALFFWSSNLAVRRPQWTRIIPRFELPVTAPGLITCISILSFLALLFSIPFFNYFGLFASQVRGQLGTCAVGLATYYLVSRRFNPMAWALFIVAFVVAVIASTVGQSGRRFLVGVMIVIPWIWYFTRWRYQRPTANLSRVGVFLVLGVIGIIMYSPFRGGSDRIEVESTISKRVDQFVELLSNPTIDTTVIKYILYADTVPNTLYVLENYPGNHAFMPFQGAIWVLSNPIPRSLWPGKPEAFGAVLRDQMNVPPNLGPGIIAHGWAEGHFVGVAAYAIFFGLLIGIIDRASMERCWNPYYLSVIGCCLGDVVALTRGDVALFVIQIIAGIIACGVVIRGVRFIAPILASFPVLLPAGWTSSDSVATTPDEHDGSSAEALHGENYQTE